MCLLKESGSRPSANRLSLMTALSAMYMSDLDGASVIKVRGL